MGLFVERPEPNQMRNSLVAGAEKIETITSSLADKSASGGEEWQKKAWDLYEQVGELHYSADFYGNCLRRIHLTTALRDRQGNVTPAWDDEGTPLHPQVGVVHDAIQQLRPEIGGQDELLAQIGVNLVVPGECFLYGEPENGAIENWSILSVEELVQESNQLMRVSANGKRIKAPDDAVSIRIWKPHPRHSKKADSAIHALLDVLEELVLLTRGVKASILSRLAGAGWLVIPQEAAQQKKAGDDMDPLDALVNDLMKAMTTPIHDPGSASAIVPLISAMPGDQIEKIKHFDFSRLFKNFPAGELRKEAVERFAQGIDLPTEIVTGVAGVNHWTAWQIDEASSKVHIEPKMEIICSALTDWLDIHVFPDLQPRIEQNGLMPIIYYDASELVAHPDESGTALVFHAKYLISDQVAREKGGYSESDAPDEEELAERLERDKARAAVPGVPADGATTDPGPPEARMLDRVEAVLDVTVDRAVRRLGARLRSKLNGQPNVRTVLDGVNDRSVAAALGPNLVANTLGKDSPFVAEFQELADFAQEQARLSGLSGFEPGKFAQRVVRAAEELAQARTYDPKAVLPPGALTFDWVKA